MGLFHCYSNSHYMRILYRCTCTCIHYTNYLDSGVNKETLVYAYQQTGYGHLGETGL